MVLINYSPHANPGPVKTTTRKGRMIPLDTSDTTPITKTEIAGKLAYFERKYPRALQRKESCWQYNCHGLTFVSRRGWLLPDHIDDILRDDDYYEITEEWHVLPGDIVIYTAESQGLALSGIDHTAVVVSTDNIKYGRNRPHGFIGADVWVVSKWSWGPEFVHRLHDCPYDECSITFWREGKNDKPTDF